jgi:glycosyltransferase involved in cell wall biosynthesis
MRLLTKRKADPLLKTIFISTQYRPHKGLDEFLEIARQLVQGANRSFRYQFIFTAFLPESVKEHFPELREQLHELTRLSNRDHALIYQLSDLVVHPSHAEGGALPYPLFEAASVGVPCLVNRGRHLDEALTQHPGLSCAVFDVNNPPAAMESIDDVLKHPSRRQQILTEVKAAWRSWEDAAHEYCEVFSSLQTEP